MVVDAAGVECAALGVRVPAGAVDFVELALDCGLASRRTPRGPLRRVASLLLPAPSISRPLPPGLVRAGAASLVHNARGMVRWWLLLAALAVVGAWAELPALIGISAAGGGFLLSVLVHEAGHVIALRCLAGSTAPGFLVSRGSRCHLVRRVLPRYREAGVVLAGPVAPSVLLPVLLTLPDMPVLVSCGWLALSSAHLITLVVPVGDGANLRRALGGDDPAEPGQDLGSAGGTPRGG